MDSEDYLRILEERVDEDGVVCKLCGEPFLIWEEGRGKHNRKRWNLVNAKGEIHDCRTAGADEMTDLDAPKGKRRARKVNRGMG